MEYPNGANPARAGARFRHLSVANVTRLGDETRHRGLCSTEVEGWREPWCESLAVCPLLTDFGIRHMGIVEAAADYCFERPNPLHTLFLATLRGTGYAGTPPTLSLLTAGHGILLPKGSPCTYFNASEHHWHSVWICFDRPECLVPGSEGAAFALDGEVFRQSMEALTICWERYGSAATTLRMMEGLMELVKLHLGIRPEMENFHSAWRTVGADLGAEWDAARIAALGGCSQERFRRLCWSAFGTSPMKHLRELRLHRARTVLSSTPLTIEEISGKFGYSDAYAFSHAFKRRFGMSPRAFRRGDVSA